MYVKNMDGVPKLSDAEFGAIRDVEDAIDAKLQSSDERCAEVAMSEVLRGPGLTPMALRALVKMYEDTGHQVMLVVRVRQ